MDEFIDQSEEILWHWPKKIDAKDYKLTDLIRVAPPMKLHVNVRGTAVEVWKF